MPRAQSRGKLEKAVSEEIEINLEDLKTKTTKPQISSMKTKTKEITVTEKVRIALDEIKTGEGIIGYILRNTKSASIDLNDPTKIIDYAILSSSIKEAGNELSQTFDLGDVEDVLVEGENVKLLHLTIDENDVSVFMEKTVDHANIRKRLYDIT